MVPPLCPIVHWLGHSVWMWKTQVQIPALVQKLELGYLPSQVSALTTKLLGVLGKSVSFLLKLSIFHEIFVGSERERSKIL